MKMKLGDMEMSADEGIRFGPSQARTTTPPEQATSTPELSPPSWSKAAILLIAAAAFLGMVATLVLTIMVSTPLALIPLPGLFLITVGALLFAHFHRSKELEDDAELSAVAIERRARLVELLEQARRPLSVEALQEELRWTDQAILTTLQDLLTGRRITEDLDLESGHWVYQINDEAVALDHEPSTALPVEERLETLPSSAQISTRKNL